VARYAALFFNFSAAQVYVYIRLLTEFEPHPWFMLVDQSHDSEMTAAGAVAMSARYNGTRE